MTLLYLCAVTVVRERAASGAHGSIDRSGSDRRRSFGRIAGVRVRTDQLLAAGKCGKLDGDGNASVEKRYGESAKGGGRAREGKR